MEIYKKEMNTIRKAMHTLSKQNHPPQNGNAATLFEDDNFLLLHIIEIVK